MTGEGISPPTRGNPVVAVQVLSMLIAENDTFKLVHLLIASFYRCFRAR